jgi:uncharacterized membrane protein
VIWLKALHMAAIAVWSAGLMVLPGLYVRRAAARQGRELHRLQGLVRFTYVAIVSPAAFVAVATGTGLVFAEQTFAPWFSLKLGLVGMLVVSHILTGLVIIRLFEEGGVYPVERFVWTTTATVGLVVGILVVVLAKPPLPDLLPAALGEPGALSRLLAPVDPFR